MAAGVVALAFVLAVPDEALADVIARGSVVKVEASELYVSIGRSQGVVDAAPLRLRRRIALKHPVTRQRVEDWIPIGEATITQAGERISRAVVGDLVGAVKVGDGAEVYVDTPEPPAPAAPTPPPETPVDRATAEVLTVFIQQSGKSLDSRIAAWEVYLAARPASPLRGQIEGDLLFLRSLRDTLSPGDDASPARFFPAGHEVPTSAPAGADVPVVFVLRDAQSVTSAWLHVRTVGDPTYRRVSLVREHDLYLRGVVPGDALREQGAEYFVEGSTSQGAHGPLVGSAEAPRRIAVAKAPLARLFEDPRERMRLTLSTMYLDFANLDRREGDRTDRALLAELDVRYRLPSLVRAISAGYGTFLGRGGARNTTWDEANPAPQVGFHYGYADVEVGVVSPLPVSAAARLIAGVGRDGFGLGGEFRIRVGDADRTNLAASVRNLAQVGFLSDLRLEARVRPSLPVGVAVAVMDQPGARDLGVRLGVDLGYAGWRHVVPVLRLSWQGRSTAHSGVGGGLAMEMRW